MATLQADDIVDLITITQRDLGKLRWTDLSYDLQEYIALPSILQKEKVTYGSGFGMQWNVMTGTSGATKDVGLYEVDSVNVADVMTTANVPWRHMTTNYAIERREIAMNTGAAQIVDLVKIRRHDAMVDLAKHLETRWWSKPDTSSDTLKIFGVPYWITWTDNSSASPNGGFDGGNPDGFSAGAGGIDSNSVSSWKNWCAKYTNVSSTDLIRKWRKAATFTKFMAPQPSPSYGTGARYGYYTNYDVIGPLEEVLESQNDNLGNDIASKDGQLLFRQVPVTWCPFLEDRAGDPIYGINWGQFKPAFLSGEYLREEGPTKASNQHTVFQTHVDLTMNVMCTDRRANFVLATAQPDPTV
tara:strand:+ start:6550 stop:7617 length:1068 start_codon:yes stop_codon:yes gene_type:complete